MPLFKFILYFRAAAKYRAFTVTTETCLDKQLYYFIKDFFRDSSATDMGKSPGFIDVREDIVLYILGQYPADCVCGKLMEAVEFHFTLDVFYISFDGFNTEIEGFCRLSRS